MMTGIDNLYEGDNLKLVNLDRDAMLKRLYKEYLDCKCDKCFCKNKKKGIY